jgi:Ni/Fe-hydrogenase subunit HybB-like protein
MENPTVAIVFIFGVVPISVFLMVIVLRYLENRENMAMIERGMDPQTTKKNRKRDLDPSQTIKNGMMFVGAGIGLLLAIMVTTMFHMEDGTGVYFALIAIFGGLGMLGAYFYERKNPPQQNEQD